MRDRQRKLRSSISLRLETGRFAVATKMGIQSLGDAILAVTYLISIAVSFSNCSPDEVFLKYTCIKSRTEAPKILREQAKAKYEIIERHPYLPLPAGELSETARVGCMVTVATVEDP
jgi:hypothetical protein